MNISINAYEDNVIAIGAHYQGKTYRIAHTVIKPLLKVANVWVWDFHGKFAQYLNITSPLLIKRRVTDLEFGTQFLMPSDKSPHAFNQFCKRIADLQNLVVVIDEAHNYSTAQKISNEHAEVVRNLGNQGVSYIEVFQRAANVHKDILSNAYHRFCLAFDVPTDVTYLRKWLGVEVELFRPIEERSKFAVLKYGARPQLKQYSFVYRNMHSLNAEVFEP